MRVPDGTTPSNSCDAATQTHRRDPRASRFASPAPIVRPSDVAVWQVVPTTAPQDAGDRPTWSTRLRDDVLPTTRTPDVEGRRHRPATSVDFADYLAGRLPLFIGAVLLLSFLLLMAVFRSLLVPLKAVVMNLLSIGAAYGVVVAVFQWGWGDERHRRRQGGPDRGVDADDAVRHRVRPVDGLRGLPALADQGGVRPHRRQRRRAVADGLAATARVITAAGADHGLRVRRLRARRRPASSSCSASAWPSPC